METMIQEPQSGYYKPQFSQLKNTQQTNTNDYNSLSQSQPQFNNQSQVQSGQSYYQPKFTQFNNSNLNYNQPQFDTRNFQKTPEKENFNFQESNINNPINAKTPSHHSVHSRQSNQFNNKPPSKQISHHSYHSHHSKPQSHQQSHRGSHIHSQNSQQQAIPNISQHSPRNSPRNSPRHSQQGGIAQQYSQHSQQQIKTPHSQSHHSQNQQKQQNYVNYNYPQNEQQEFARESSPSTYQQHYLQQDFPPPIDYNYPTANRTDTMYLNTVQPRDAKYRKFKQLNTDRDYSANLFNLDIPGTSPKKFGIMNNKPDFTNRNDDIERSNPKMLHILLNKPEYNLSNKDIEFSSASTVRIHETRCSKHIKPAEALNPLEPKYKLPTVENIDIPVPKFIRDNIQIDDIKGSKPKKYYKWETRKGFIDDNVEGSHPKKPYLRSPNTKYDYINYNDVTQDKFKTRRHINPLDPIYDVRYKNK